MCHVTGDQIWNAAPPMPFGATFGGCVATYLQCHVHCTYTTP